MIRPAPPRIAIPLLSAALLLAVVETSRGQTGRTSGDPLDARFPATISITDKIRIGGDVRFRVEDRRDPDLGLSAPSSDTALLPRVRLDLRWKFGRRTEGFLEIQDTRAWNEELEYPGEEGQTDLKEAFVRWVSPPPAAGGATVRLRLGRQEFGLGSETLLGPEPWMNAGRSWDGVSFEWEKIRLRSRVLAGMPDGLNGIDSEDATLLVYSASLPVPWKAALPGTPPGPRVPARIHRLEPAILFLHDDREGAYPGDGSLQEWTLDLRSTGPLPRMWEYEGELAFQLGDYGTGNLQAFALRGVFRRDFGQGRQQVRLEFLADWASGDDDRGDEDRHSFDPLFPSYHGRLGEMDLVQWSNVRRLGAVLSSPKGRFGTFSTAWSYYTLDDSRDDWRNARGEVVRPGVAGAPRELGSELDLIWHYRWNDSIDFRASMGRFWPGDFPAETGPDKDASILTLQGNLRF